MKTICKHECAGGFSRKSEDFSCFSESFRISIIGIVVITITLLVFFLLCCCTIRAAYVPHRTLREMPAIEQNALPHRTLRGMSAFERNSLGSIVFSKQLLQEWIEEGQRSSSCDSSALSDGPQSESTEEQMMISCECSICLDIIMEGQQCRRLPLPCGHLFHIGCIDEWLKQSVHCPLCKRSATTEGVVPSTSTTGYHSIINDIAPNEEFV